ncbi:DUF2949 domain-containing protein [Nodosilinea sp. LEGE 07088]|uniref:DUF2949 domain-containing protein n=1 Tax=Nodosilinea sp. LEGE 07088 TaxID=2777968 RepID=UPI00187F51E4|nr:DUF2949 domain-containing protein [Nodosilinea sp. LEGE 07088]MBE9137489.1 DUF2949 domain-containing protein [Nodosilinea sp. LEGE 07088]
MTLPQITRLVRFVQAEFGVSTDEVSTALNHNDGRIQFPIILWQYGFISLSQLEHLFDWLERERACPAKQSL